MSNFGINNVKNSNLKPSDDKYYHTKHSKCFDLVWNVDGNQFNRSNLTTNGSNSLHNIPKIQQFVV